MFASSWLHRLQHHWFGCHAIRRVHVRRVRLCLEALEDCTLLSSPATTGELINAIQNANTAGGTTTITLAANTAFRSGRNAHFFAGLLLAEVAQLLGISPRTADHLGTSARAWLHQLSQDAVFALDAV
jgi:hypothetical protein